MDIRRSGSAGAGGFHGRRAGLLVAGLLSALVVLALLLSAPAAAAPQTPFVAAISGVWDGPGNPVIPEVVVSGALGPVQAETGSLPSAYGLFRSDYGVHGYLAQTTGGIDREVDGGSVWSDGFSATGGAGGTLALSTRITGTASGDAEMFFALFVSAQPFDFQTLAAAVDAAPGFWAVQLPGATRVLYTGIANRCGLPGASNECGHAPYENFQGPFDLTLATGVPFTPGQTLYVASVFGGGVGVFGGSQDFSNSAHFGISAPAGTTLASLSGTAYAAAVPEPAAWLLLLAGAAGLALRRRALR